MSKFKTIEINEVTYTSSLIGECEKCRGEQYIFYNDNGEALCETCLVDYENKTENFDTEDLFNY